MSYGKSIAACVIFFASVLFALVCLVIAFIRNRKKQNEAEPIHFSSHSSSDGDVPLAKAVGQMIHQAIRLDEEKQQTSSFVAARHKQADEYMRKLDEKREQTVHDMDEMHETAHHHHEEMLKRLAALRGDSDKDK